MKLDELTLPPPEGNLRPGILEQLRIAGVKELAAYVSLNEEALLTVFVATDVGIYVATEITVGDAAGTVEGTLTPWSEVAGARLAMAGYGHEYTTVIAKVAAPAFDEKESASTERRQALIDFANVCMRRQGRWSPRE